jgi:amicoumacin kinase
MEDWVSDLLRPEHLHQAVRLWQAASEPELISAVESFVYFLERDGHRRVLRLTHSSHRTAAQIAGELEWIAYLSGRGVRACSPLPSCAGRLAEILPAADGCFVAAVFEAAPGRRVRKDDPETWNAALFRNWGRTLGRISST